MATFAKFCIKVGLMKSF